MSVDRYFTFCREREHIRLNKTQGLPREYWTEDRVLRTYRFCNVYREDDTTTVWFREHVRQPQWAMSKVLFSTIAFRWFNLIETGDAIHVWLHGTWNRGKVYDVLNRRREAGHKLFTGAYLINSPAGKDKLTGILDCLDLAVPIVDKILKESGGWAKTTLEVMHQELMAIPYLGRFMAYEVVTDLRHTYLLRDATDIFSWASAGPGCARGLGWIQAEDPDMFCYTSRQGQADMLGLMRTLLLHSQDPKHWPAEWPKWEMREVEHTLCEYDKYRRGCAGQSLKRKYVDAG